jgi:hypothetical protein
VDFDSNGLTDVAAADLRHSAGEPRCGGGVLLDIPMGGVLPVQGQRVIRWAAPRAWVHPPGYMVARTLGAQLPQLADRVVDGLSRPRTD